MPAHGAQSPEGGGPWGSRTVPTSGEQAHLLTTKGEPPGAQGLHSPAREPSPAPRWGTGAESLHGALHISVFKVGHSMPLNCP